jgi:hypothetical protein
MDIFLAYFPLPRNGYLYPWGKLVGYAFSGATKKAKKKPFYSVKWIFFAYFPFPSNEYLYSWCKRVGYAFSGATKYAKNLHFTL